MREQLSCVKKEKPPPSPITNHTNSGGVPKKYRNNEIETSTKRKFTLLRFSQYNKTSAKMCHKLPNMLPDGLFILLFSPFIFQ